MGKATIELVYVDRTRNRQVAVDFRVPDRRTKTLDRIEAAGEKAFKSDPDWVSWNLINLEGC